MINLNTLSTAYYLYSLKAYCKNGLIFLCVDMVD